MTKKHPYEKYSKERIFFAKDKASAIKYAKKVNKREGNSNWLISTIKLKKYQIPHIDKWKTWIIKSK